MKDLKNFICESSLPEFAQKALDLANKAKIETKIENGAEEDYLGFISKYTITKTFVSVVWKNGKTVQRARGQMWCSSEFDNEPIYIKIKDWYDDYFNRDHSKTSEVERLSKELYTNLFDAGLKEATNGKTSQWGSWKFAIRSKEDEEIALQHLNTYLKALKKAYN